MIFILFFCTGLSIPDDSVVYTEVPRGLIISVDEKIFFDSCGFELKQESYNILNQLANLLKKIPNDCVIENHSQKTLCEEKLENWELSMMRSAIIADYLIKNFSIPQSRLFDIGYGEFMPFRQNVDSEINGMDNRIDFVILDYEASR